MTTDQRSAARQAAAHLSLTLPAGTRVLDTESGEEGTVLGGVIQYANAKPLSDVRTRAVPTGFTLPHVVQFESFQVALDSGEKVMRDAEFLHALPAALAAPLEDFTPPEAA